MADVTVLGNDFQALPRKYKDMGDGTYAEVVAGTSTALTGITLGRVVVACPVRSGLAVNAPNNILAGRMPLTAYAAMSNVRFMYGGMANDEKVPDNEVLVEAALEYGGVIYPMTFTGSRFGILDRYGLLTSDAALIDIPAGATYYARTRVLAPNNSSNFGAAAAGYTTLAADVISGAASITLTDLPKLDRSPARFRITGTGTEVVEILRYTGTATPWTVILRSVLAANHTAAGNQVGQGVWSSREVCSDQGGTASSNVVSFDLLSGTFGAAGLSGTATTAAASSIGDTAITVTSVNLLRGQTFTLDTAGNAETVTVRNIGGSANPWTLYLTAPLTKNHLTAVSLANTNSGSSILIPVPTAVTADYASGAPVPIVLLGDSILQGTGNNFRVWEGYATQALDATHPILNLTKNGESASQFAADTNGTQRRRLLGVGKWLFLAFGTNDLYGASTLLQYQTNIGTIVGWARARGMKIAIPTITPRSTSTDGFITTGNQTEVNAGSGGLLRKQANTWIRAGAGGLCDLVIEVADVVETARDSGIWKADANPGPYTVDGLHPSYAGHQLIASSINSALFI